MTTSTNHLLPELLSSKNEQTHTLGVQLNSVWNEFNKEMDATPLVSAIRAGTINLADVKRFIKSMRAQVIDGGSWISRAASSFDAKSSRLALEARRALIRHAAEEQNDFMMLDNDYAQLGGVREDIETAEQNIATHALSSFILWQASLPNPYHILGAQFIIEGVGKIKTTEWVAHLRKCLRLRDDQMSFMLYHSVNDEHHFQGLERFLMLPDITKEAADKIVLTARTVAFLYVEQIKRI